MRFQLLHLLAISFLFLIPGKSEAIQVTFTEVTEQIGIFENTVDFGFGGGVSAFDYDEDGDIDLFLPQRFDAADRLYINDGTGRFDEGAVAAGLDVLAAGRSALWFDYDDDHLVDLLIASDCHNSIDPNCIEKSTIRLFRQLPGRQFVDVTDTCGLSNEGIEEFFGHRAGMCVGDIDRDGDLDFLVGQWNGELQLFMNEGGFFVNETDERGIFNPLSPFPFNSWQSVMHDFNGDGWLDIFTAVDFHENQLWINQRDGTFIEVAPSAGVDFAFNEMGVTVGDCDNDGDLDIFVTNIFEEEKHNLLLRNDSSIDNVVFTEISAEAGVADTGFGWGCSFFDADNDTDLDLAATNGWFNGIGFDDRSRMFINEGVQGQIDFEDISISSGFNDEFYGSCLIS
ncbi:MAG: VCBS repeat-containing protein, partial [Planctomycetota bacterium]